MLFPDDAVPPPPSTAPRGFQAGNGTRSLRSLRSHRSRRKRRRAEQTPLRGAASRGSECLTQRIEVIFLAVPIMKKSRFLRWMRVYQEPAPRTAGRRRLHVSPHHRIPVPLQIEKLKALTTYFGVWKPPPTNQRLAYIREELLPKIKWVGIAAGPRPPSSASSDRAAARASPRLGRPTRRAAVPSESLGTPAATLGATGAEQGGYQR